MESGFFENKLRGYRLLKSSKLSASEKQHVLMLTMFAEAETDIADEMKHGKCVVWFGEALEDWMAMAMEKSGMISNGGTLRPTGLGGRPNLGMVPMRRRILWRLL